MGDLFKSQKFDTVIARLKKDMYLTYYMIFIILSNSKFIGIMGSQRILRKCG